MSVEILSPYNIASPLNLSKIIKNGATWPLTHPFRGIRAWVGLFYHYTEIPLDDLEFQDLDARKLDSLSYCPALCRTVILILHLSVFGITPTCDRRKDTCHTIFYASATDIAQSVDRAVQMTKYRLLQRKTRSKDSQQPQTTEFSWSASCSDDHTSLAPQTRILVENHEISAKPLLK